MLNCPVSGIDRAVVLNVENTLTVWVLANFGSLAGSFKIAYQEPDRSTPKTPQVGKVDFEHLSFIISDFSFSHFLKPAHERRVVVLRRSTCDAINGHMMNVK